MTRFFLVIVALSACAPATTVEEAWAPGQPNTLTELSLEAHGACANREARRLEPSGDDAAAIADVVAGYCMQRFYANRVAPSASGDYQAQVRAATRQSALEAVVEIRAARHAVSPPLVQPPR